MTNPLANRLQGSGLYATRSAAAPTSEVKAKPAPSQGNPVTPKKCPKPNQYAGKCLSCGGEVPAGMGTITKDANGKWKPVHLPGECVAQPALPGIGANLEPVKGQRGGRFTAPSVHPGIYTVETPDGHRTFRVFLQPPDEKFAPGDTLLELLTGPDNDHDYQTIGFINGKGVRFFKKYREAGNLDVIAAAEQLAADPESALVAKHCLRCNATLSRPESIAAGLGPDCVRKGW